jgi:hypothetical protein
MTPAELRAAPTLPPGLSPALAALWHDARGDWERAHQVAQGDRTAAGSWVHAYLHRKEGDAGNAAYWYSRAGRPVPKGALEDEWADLARDRLDSNPTGGPDGPRRVR